MSVFAVSAIVLELHMGMNLLTNVLEAACLSMLTPALCLCYGDRIGLPASATATSASILLAWWLMNKPMYPEGSGAIMPLIYISAWFAGSLAYALWRWKKS
ncbi:MAG: hypothetical protein QXI20_02330 [Candidatus Jordarchaeales archaeon]